MPNASEIHNNNSIYIQRAIFLKFEIPQQQNVILLKNTSMALAESDKKKREMKEKESFIPKAAFNITITREFRVLMLFRYVKCKQNY